MGINNNTKKQRNNYVNKLSFTIHPLSSKRENQAIFCNLRFFFSLSGFLFKSRLSCKNNKKHYILSFTTVQKQALNLHSCTSQRSRSCDYTTYLNAISNNDLQTQTARSYCKKIQYSGFY